MGNIRSDGIEKDTAAEALATIKSSDYELISQSKSVIACQGQKKKTYHNWLNMVAFDQDRLTACRKYLLVMNEKPGIRLLLADPSTGITYDSEMVLDRELLDKPYGSENARRIAVLKQVAENARKDIEQVKAENKSLEVYGMVISQAFDGVVLKIEQSPAVAARLSEPAGMEFGHISLDKGRIQITIDGDIVTVKMMLGSFVRYFESRKELR